MLDHEVDPAVQYSMAFAMSSSVDDLVQVLWSAQQLVQAIEFTPTTLVRVYIHQQLIGLSDKRCYLHIEHF